MNREELIALVSEITRLRAEVARLGDLQKELRRLEHKLDQVQGVEAAPQAKRAGGESLEERVERFLLEGADREWKVEDIANRLGAKIPSVRSACSRLRKAKKLSDPRRGYVQHANEKTDPNTVEEEVDLAA